MLTSATKRFLPAVVRAQLTSPATYPALSHAFSSIASRKQARSVYKIIHAPRPKPELQNWNVHGTTTQSAAPGTVKPTMMQMQSWNHHDPISEVGGGFYYPQTASDLQAKAIEMELINEEAQNEIVASTGRMQASPKSMPRRKLPHPYYPQYASDLANEAYEMDHQDEHTIAAKPKEEDIGVALNPLPHTNLYVPLDYPQGASDLTTKAYEMDHLEEMKSGRGREKPTRTAPPPAKSSMSTVGAPFYPQYATDLAPEAYEMEHPEEKTGGQ